MENLLKRTYKMNSYDISAIKVISALFGLWIGATWPELYKGNEIIVWGIVIVLSIYILKKYSKQIF